MTAFVSYAREDSQFVARLRSALDGHSIHPMGDWDLTAGDDYERRLREFVLGADAFLFVISPDSLTSQACRGELAFAVEQKKVILPICFRDHGDDNRLDSSLRAPQWTFLRESDAFDAGVDGLARAIHTDQGLLDVHSRLLLLADQWVQSGRKSSETLGRASLKEAESWLAVTSTQPEKLPQPTAQQVELIVASRERRARATRFTLSAAAVIVVSLALLAVVAWIQRGRAVQNALEATRQEQIAKSNATRAREVGKRRLLIATLLLNPEGTKFSTILRNFDGTGLTFGIGAWNQKMGGLGRLLQEFQRAEPDLFVQTFGDGDAATAVRLLAQTTAAGGGVDQKGNATDPSVDLLQEPWLGRFERAAALPKLQSVQLTVFTDEYLLFMTQLQSAAPEIQSERGVAFLLDMVRQHGTGMTMRMLKAVQAEAPGVTEAEQLRLLEKKSVERTPRFARFVKGRREMFLNTPYLTDTAVGF